MPDAPPPYGLWPSPIRADMLAQDLRLGGVGLDPTGTHLAWLESRGAGNAVMVATMGDGAPRELTRGRPVRALVGYGGGDFALGPRALFFIDQASGRVYRQDLAGGEARPITPAFGHAASPTPSPDGRWLAFVHSDADGVDRLAVVDAQGRAWPQVLAQGHDFYMQPRWSPDGRLLAYVAWDHPAMPWDATLLYVAPVVAPAGGAGLTLPRLGEPRAVAGGEEVAVFQPEFSPDGGTLYFVSDETGWGHLAALDLATGQRRRLTSGEVEHGQAAWVQDLRSYALTEGGRSAHVLRTERGFRRLYRLDLAGGDLARVPSLADYDEVSHIAADAGGRQLVLVASSSRRPPRVLSLDVATGQSRVLARASAETLDPAGLAEAEAVRWEGEGGQGVEGLFYAPPGKSAPGLPPVVVLIHGGPTSHAGAGWNAACQFLATRGFAVLAVNHRGSTGYGRAYLRALSGAWGEADVADAVSGLAHVAAAGRVDGARAAIMGGSAGGYTVLRALSTAPGAFAAGVCMYGISDLFQLARTTHKFELRYLDSLIGTLPEAAELYRARSPLLQPERITRPVAIFQGADDKVVPREQSEAMVADLRARGVPHEYHVYAGEGHGWRKPETIQHFWEAVEDFLRRQLVYGSG